MTQTQRPRTWKDTGKSALKWIGAGLGLAGAVHAGRTGYQAYTDLSETDRRIRGYMNGYEYSDASRRLEPKRPPTLRDNMPNYQSSVGLEQYRNGGRIRTARGRKMKTVAVHRGEIIVLNPKLINRADFS